MERGKMGFCQNRRVPQAVRRFLLSGALLVASLWAILTLSLPQFLDEPIRVGQPSPMSIGAPQEVIYTSEVLTAERRAQAENSSDNLVYVYEPTIPVQQRQDLVALLDNIASLRADPSLSRAARLEALVALPSASLQLSERQAEQILSLDEAGWDQLRAQTLSLYDRAIERYDYALDERALLQLRERWLIYWLATTSLPPNQRDLAKFFTESFLRVNRTLDEQTTAERREQARNSVPPQSVRVLAGEQVVSAGEIVTPQIIEKLQRTETIPASLNPIESAGYGLLAALLTCAFLLFAAQAKSVVFQQPSGLLAIMSIFFVVVTIARFVEPLTPFPFLVFLLIAVIIALTLFVEPVIALASILLLSLVIGASADFDLVITTVLFLGCFLGVLISEFLKGWRGSVVAGLTVALVTAQITFAANRVALNLGSLLALGLASAASGLLTMLLFSFAARYRGTIQAAYELRYNAGDALDRLILLQAPLGTTFTAEYMIRTLGTAGVPSIQEAVQIALSGLSRRGLVRPDAGGWQLTDVVSANLFRRSLPDDELGRLSVQVRERQPNFADALRLLKAAGFTIERAGPVGIVCASDLPLWSDVSPLYAHLLADQVLNSETIKVICDELEQIGGGRDQPDIAQHLVLLIIDRAPAAAELHQIFALRAQRQLTFVPVPRSLIIQALLDNRAPEALREQIDTYMGRADLYDTRTAVTDVLSFFGRVGTLAELRRRLTLGQPVYLSAVRKMGKSSLLTRLREEMTWPTALIDASGYLGGLEYLYEDALRAWHAAIATLYPDHATVILPPLDEEPAARAQQFRHGVEALLESLNKLPDRPGLLLFLDELDSVHTDPGYLGLSATIRSLVESPKARGRFAICAAGLSPLLNRVDRQDGQRNPFFAFFAELRVAPLEPADSRAMISSIGGQMGVSYTAEALNYLAEVGGGHPFLTRQICSLAVRDLERPATIDIVRARTVVKAYLKQPRNYAAESLWGFDSGGPDASEAALLSALAAREPQADSELISDRMPVDLQRQQRIVLERLHDMGLVQESAGSWTMTFPFYRRWIRATILGLRDEDRDEIITVR